jgi:hypothetical protein
MARLVEGTTEVTIERIRQSYCGLVEYGITLQPKDGLAYYETHWFEDYKDAKEKARYLARAYYGTKDP